jgi:hypothetical protein
MKKVFLAAISMILMAGSFANAADEAPWLQISGDYRFRYDWLKGQVHDYDQILNPFAPVGPGNLQAVPDHSVKNDSLMLNRFGLNLKGTPLEDVSVKARMVMYKIWGQETSNSALDNAFADRFGGTNDGDIGHFPQDNTLRVDYAYVTVSNILGAPAWFSIGRRPSTGGVPGNIRQNTEKVGSAGIPNLLVDYAFDGLSIGYAPDIEALPGSYVKLCYGKGFEAGFETSTTTLKDTNFFGLNMAVIDSENIHAELQYQKGMNIFNNPSDGLNLTVPSGAGNTTMILNSPVTANLGDIDWLGGVVMSKTGDLHLFASAAESMTHPKGSAAMLGNPDLTVGLLNNGTGQDKHTGYAFYVGGRYDIKATGTKIGAEYNQGSKNWIGIVPAGDDIWTSKLGTRGSVYEIYLIQELKRAAISKNGKAFVRLGYQYYKFDYTGSNNWLGAPMKISDITLMTPQLMPPYENAKDLYLTFDVQF